MAQITIDVAPATLDVLSKLADFAAKLKAAGKNGWTVGAVLPAALSASLTDLAPALQEVSAVEAEFAGDKYQFESAVNQGGQALVKAVLS